MDKDRIFKICSQLILQDDMKNLKEILDCCPWITEYENDDMDRLFDIARNNNKITMSNLISNCSKKWKYDKKNDKERQKGKYEAEMKGEVYREMSVKEEKELINKFEDIISKKI